MSKEPLRPNSPEIEQTGWLIRALDAISGVYKWIAQRFRDSLRLLKDTWDNSDKFIKEKYHAYLSLTFISFLLVAINITEVFMIETISSSQHPLLWLLALPGAILGFWLLLMLRCCHDAVKEFRRKWHTLTKEIKKEYQMKFSARAGIIIGTLVPVIFCQFIFMPLYALPQFRKAIWTLTYDNTKGLEVPMVVFSALWGDAPDPKLSLEVSCKLEEMDVGCNAYQGIQGRWNYGVLVNFTESITLKPAAELFIKAEITTEEPGNLHAAGGVIPLHYEFIDPIFSNDISAAFNVEDDRYPYYLPYPWDTTDFFIANIDQMTVDDGMNTLGWSTYEEFPMYNLYNVISESADTINENTTCFNTTSGPCIMSLTLQVTPSSNVIEKRQSGPGIDSVTILIDEGAIVGGVAFVAFFLGIYVV